MRRLWHLCFLAIALHGVCAFADSFTERVVAAFNEKDPKLQATAKSDDEIHLTTPIGSNVRFTTLYIRRRPALRDRHAASHTIRERKRSGAVRADH